jgi:hypothetical protein
MHELLRRELLEPRRTTGLGSFLLAQPIHLWVQTGVTIANAFAVASSSFRSYPALAGRRAAGPVQ